MTDSTVSTAGRTAPVPGMQMLQGGIKSGRLAGPARSAILLLIVFAVFSIATDNFATTTNLSSLLSFAAPAILVAIGQTFVISLGEIDLSVASVAALSGIVLIINQSNGLLIAFVAALGTGLLAGLITGALTAFLRVPSLVSSLAMLFIAQGFALVLASQPVTGSRMDLTIFFATPIGPILSVRTTIVLAVVLAAAVLLGLTPVGRAMFARGSNPQGVKALGLPSRSTVVGAFLASGLLASFAGAVIAIGLNSASPVVGGDLLLLGIAACLIGGSRLEGGTGSIIGTTLALLALITLANGMDQLGVSSYVQQVTQGAVVLVALLASSSPRAGGVNIGASPRRLTSALKGGPRPDPRSSGST